MLKSAIAGEQMKTTRQALGQYMTPCAIADLMAKQIPHWITGAIDLAAGDCSLLRAVSKRRPQAGLYGCELDHNMWQKGKKALHSARLQNGNGLTAPIRISASHSKALAVLGNPPFTEVAPSPEMTATLKAAFPGLSTKLGYKRSELYFLARSLLLAKERHGIVVILMPIGFADGDIYRQYREILMQHYSLTRVIEVPGNMFSCTEARTSLLVIDTRTKGTRKTEISRYVESSGKVEAVFKGEVLPGSRLDARFHAGRRLAAPNTIQLKDLGVTIQRGILSKKELETLNISAVHTTDLSKARAGQLTIVKNTKATRRPRLHDNNVFAQPGDILLSRTGTRVCWQPVVVRSGQAPITDHVFRIRAPQKAARIVKEAFLHPLFSTWLDSIAKGVCATVITKRELLQMPLFSDADNALGDNRFAA